jgi:hypothetical protein
MSLVCIAHPTNLQHDIVMPRMVGLFDQLGWQELSHIQADITAYPYDKVQKFLGQLQPGKNAMRNLLVNIAYVC